MLSSVCDPGLEEIAAAAPGALRLFQLYVRGDDAWVDDHVERAIAYGYAGFCVTVDTAHYSRRERDIAKRFVTAGRRRVQGRAFQAGLDWRTVERIKSKFTIPLAIKGIATAEDAAIALDHGVEWIYVSNHGGRQLDHGRGSLDVLPEVVDAVAGRARIIVDGSICRGTDIVKAIAAGADLVGIGRMQCYALAAGGQAGVVRLLELLEDEVQRCLGLLGVTRLADLDRSYLLGRRAGERAARAQRVSAAQDRGLPVLRALERQPGPEHLDRIEIELGIEAALDVAGLAEAVLLAGEQEIADRIALAPQRLDHGLGLVRRHDGVLVALEEDHRLRQPVRVIERRALAIARFLLRIGSDQPVEIARLELVGVARERGDVAHAVIARPALEEVAEGERRERRVAAGAAAADDAALAVDPALLGEEAARR